MKSAISASTFCLTDLVVIFYFCLLLLPLCSAGQVKAPFPPTNVHACEVSDTYVVLSWAEPEPRGREPLTFYVERVRFYSHTHTHTHILVVVVVFILLLLL